MLRAGLVGCNFIAEAHREAYEKIAKESGLVALEAICDIRPEQMEPFSSSIRRYTDVKELFKEEQGKLDFIDICLPTFLHAPIAVAAMEAGFHVLCEKPMARTVAQAEEMLNVSRRTNRTLMVAHCCRFREDAQLIKEVIDSGELGKPRNAEFHRQGGSKEAMGWNNWFRNGQLSGGALLDLHIHDVDLLRGLFGFPDAVSVAAASVITDDGYDALSANFYYDNGFYANAMCDWTIAHEKYRARSIRVNFEKGYIYSNRTSGHETFVKVSEDGSVTDYWNQIDTDPYKDEIVYFCKCIENGLPVSLCPPEHSVDALRIVTAELCSAKEKGTRIAVVEGDAQ